MRGATERPRSLLASCSHKEAGRDSAERDMTLDNVHVQAVRYKQERGVL